MLQEYVAKLSTRFVDLPPDQTDQGIREALETIGEHLPADRTSALFRAAGGSGRLERAEAWSATRGFETQPGDADERLLLGRLPWLAERLGKLESVAVDAIGGLPAAAAAEAEWLAESGAQAALFIPMVHRGALRGVLRVEQTTGPRAWQRDEILLLRMLADMIVGLVERQRSEASHRRSLERLGRTQRLEVVGRLASGIAHDFNNVLTAILGYSDLLEDDLEQDHPSQQEIGEIRRAAERASDLIEQILAFSRRKQAEPRLLDLNLVVLDLERMLDRVTGEDVDVSFALTQEHATVVLDPARLEQVLVNLAVNARDAMPDGGQLRFATHLARVDERGFEILSAGRHGVSTGLPAGDYVVLSASDSGVGMTADVRERLFEPFFTTKPSGRGTGLGLATVAEIVDEAHGAITVESEPGAGARFDLFIPRAAEAEIVDSVETFEAADVELKGAGEVVMLVEPDRPVRALLRRILEGHGYVVMEAPDPDAAFAAIDRGEGRPDLLLTDLSLPRLAGREIAKTLRERVPDIRVLFTSAYPETMLREAGLPAGATHVIEKPFCARTLALRVHEALEV